MTKYELEQYRISIREIVYLEKKINDLCNREVATVSGKVVASSKYFPYTQYRVSVEMDEPKERERIDKRVNQWKSRVEKLIEQTQEIEDFIDNIEDAELRMIFRYRYSEGMKLEVIAEKLCLERSTVSKRINEFMKAR